MHLENSSSDDRVLVQYPIPNCRHWGPGGVAQGPCGSVAVWLSDSVARVAEFTMIELSAYHLHIDHVPE